MLKLQNVNNKLVVDSIVTIALPTCSETPQNPDDLVNKAYVDSLTTGSIKINNKNLSDCSYSLVLDNFKITLEKIRLII